MQSVMGQKHYDRPRFTTIRDLLRDCDRRFGSQPAYRYHDKPGGTETVHTFHEFVTAIDQLGTGLFLMGLAGQHVAVIGDNSYEWAIAHNAVVNGLGVAVPLDKQLPDSEVVNLCQRGEVSALIYGPKHHAVAQVVAAANQQIRYFICMRPGVITATLLKRDSRFIEFASVLDLGATALTAGDRRFVDAPIDPQRMSCLLFTSGTTAMSKGVMLCHRNITHNIYAAASTIDLAPGQNALSVLPLHHTFENTVGMYLILSFGCCIFFTDGLRYLADNLKTWRIDLLLAVPLLFENIYHTIHRKLEKTGKLKMVNALRFVARVLLKLGIDVRRRLFHQILEGLGGKDNIVSLDCCATRLRVTVKNPDKVSDTLLKQSGAAGVIRKGGGVQVVYGPQVSVIKSELEDYMKNA
jgi:long-chain acyl-CoA synthetase